MRIPIVLIMVTGCAGDWFPPAASAQFAADTTCQSSTVMYRRDLSAPGDRPGTYEAYELRGCGRDAVYKCQAFPTDNGGLAPLCVQTSWCTGPGCATDDIRVATQLFSTRNSCPVDRLHANSTASPEQPAPDVASDPERLALWTRTRDPGVGYVAVDGCDTRALYRCVLHAPDAPTCALTTSAAGPRRL